LQILCTSHVSSLSAHTTLSCNNNHTIQYIDKVLPNAQEGKEVSSDDDDTPTTSNNSSNSTTSDQFAAQQQTAENALAIKKQYQEAASEGMTNYASLMYKYEGGISPFYSGVVTSAVQSATEKALYFFAYTFLKNGYVTCICISCFCFCV